MKKILTIMVILAFVMTFAFADTTPDGSNTVQLTSEVDDIQPAFAIYGGTAKNETTGAVTSGSKTAVSTSTSIGEGTVKVYFEVKQEGEANSKTYARCRKTVAVKVTVGNLIEQDVAEGVTAASVPGHILDWSTKTAGTYSSHDGTGSAGTAASGKSLTSKIAISGTATGEPNTATATVVYTGKAADQTIVTFTGVWYQDDSVPNGTYKADIKMEYTIS